MSQDRFDFSGHPNYIEWYQCYNDLASKDWLDGMELKLHKGVWNERALAKWNFFYRPFRPVVGRPQKKMIGERRAAIGVSRAEIEGAQRGIAEEQERIRKLMIYLAIAGTFLVAIGVWFGTITEWLIIVPALGALIVLGEFAKKRNLAQGKIDELEKKIKLHTGIIKKNEKEIKLLEDEIQFLVKQIPKPESTEKIEGWLREEIADMELACLSEFVGTTVTRDDVDKHLTQDFGDPRVYGLLIDSWGFLQPTALKGPLGRESTGLGRARDELKRFVATWQVGGASGPIFRLLFLQYIFPLKRNLNICSFFYDFVTRRTYGKRLETFQYNHVTNYSIREVETEEEPWVQETGLTTLSGLFTGKTLRALTIAVSSGNHFRCVLVDEDVVDVLNAVLRQEEKYRILEASTLNDAELREAFKGDTRLIGEWKEAEKARIEAEMKEVVREKQQIQWTSSRTPRVLTHVRNCVEEYIHRFQEAASVDGAPRS
jgi:hypothetical protein